MSQHIPKFIWLVIFLLAVALGIWPGVALGQQDWIFFGALFGWLLLPLDLYALITRSYATNPVFWPQLLVAGGYPLAMLVYGACAYWTMRRTGIKRKGLLMAVATACISTLVSIPVAAMMIPNEQGMNFLHVLAGYLPAALSIHGIILFQLLISAVLGWLIAVSLLRLHRPRTGVAA